VPPSRADLLKRYRQRLEVSRKWRKKEHEQTWRRLIDLYKGKHFKHTTKEDRVAVNIAFATVNVIMPSVAVNHPKITVGARDPEDYAKACILEAVINYWWRHYDVRDEFRLAVKDFLIIGHGWLKTGYRFTEEQQAAAEEELQQQFQEMAGQADEFAVQNPELAGSLPTDEEIAANLPTTKSVVVEDRPFAERVSPFDVFVDPEATSMSDLGWIAHRIVRPLEEVRTDDRYKPGARRKVKPDASFVWNEDEDAKKDRDKYGDDIKRVTVWEFYDVRLRTMCVFSDLSDEFLVDPRPMPYHFGHPFVQLRNYDVPDQFYPMGDLEAIEALNLELDKTRSQMINARKRWARKWLYKEEAFDSAARDALEDPTDGRLVRVNEGFELAEVMQPVPEGSPIPPEIFNQSSVIEDDINLVSGVSEYQRGATPEVRRTATEASMIQDATNARAADKLALVEGAISSVAENLVQLAQQYLTEEGTARVVGKDGRDLWVPFEPDDIQGEFDFEVEGGSTQPNNESFRRQQAIDLMNVMGPLVQIGVVNPAALAEHVLKYGFNIKDPQKFLGQNADPMAALGNPALLPPDQGGQGDPALGAPTPLPPAEAGAPQAAPFPPQPQEAAY
jgi:hypothetical protein